MQLKGSHIYKASPEKIWSMLMNPEILAKITPGVSKLDLVAEDSYEAIAEVKIGPVKGSFKGKVDLEDKEAPKSFKLLVKQNSKIGNVSADIAINLSPVEEGCKVAFDGKAKLSGLLARTGQRVLSGVSNTLSKQFFAALEKELEGDSPEGNSHQL